MLDLLGDAFSLYSQLISTLGYTGIFLLMIIVAPEFILLYTGYLITQTQLEFVWVLVVSTLGALVGQLCIYGAARAFGEARTRVFIQRFGRWLLLTEADYQRVLDMFARFDSWFLILGRFLPTVRSLVSLPAGFLPLSVRRFVLLTVIGSGMWNALLLLAGSVLGREWTRLTPLMQYYQWLGLIVLLLLLANAWRRRRATKH